jgi:hypothetical protein
MTIYQTNEKWIPSELPNFLFFVYDNSEEDTNNGYTLSDPGSYFVNRLVKIYND